MSEGYVIAEMQLQDGYRVRVEQHARTSKSSRQQVRVGRVVFEDDILADIIVRGIRSLEEEREELLERGKKPRHEDWQDDDMGGRCGYGDD